MPLVTSCPSCGARVDAPPRDEAYVHQCRFCGMNIPIEPDAKAVRRKRETQEAAERNARAQAIQNQVQASVKAGRSIAWVITFATLIPVCIPLFIFLGPVIKGLVGSRFGSFPIEVGMNDSIEISDRTASADDTLITMGINSKVTLRNCHLKGPLIVKGAVNAEITIIDSTLDGTKGIFDVDEPNVVITIQNSTLTSAEEILDDGASNVKLTVSKNSKLTAQAVALPASVNAEISVDHSSVEGKMGGIEIKNNGKVKLTDGATVKSDGPAIDLSNNGKLSIANARVESKTTAVHAANNLEGTLRSATLVGPKAALDVGNNAHVTLASSTVNGPKLVPKYSTLDER
jgi:hypothetical protein